MHICKAEEEKANKKTKLKPEYDSPQIAYW
jgi:hypothetical protein